MTCCIGVVDHNKHCCYVGADSCISADSFHIQTNTSKVFYALGHKDIVWGCAGSIRMANLISMDNRMFPEQSNPPHPTLQKYIDAVKNSGKLTTDWDIYRYYIICYAIPILKEYADSLQKDHNEFDLLLAIKDTLFRIQDDLSVYEIRDFATIGCGCCTAYGAMKAYESLRYLGYKKPYPIEGAIQQSIQISAGYDYGVDMPVTILNTSGE